MLVSGSITILSGGLVAGLDAGKIYNMFPKMGDGLVPPGLPGYEEVRLTGFDPDRARRLLAEAGYPEGAGFRGRELLFNTSESHKQIAEVIQTNVGGSRAGVFREGGEEFPIVVRLQPQDRLSTLDLGNGGRGIFLFHGTHTVGGEAAGEANVIAHNGGAGIVVGSTSVRASSLTISVPPERAASSWLMRAAWK